MRHLLSATLCLACASSRAELAPSSQWLKAVADETPLASIHLPGTHNSAALFEPLAGTARCQSLTINNNSKLECAFSIIRCRHHKDRFLLYHGAVPQKQSFAELQTTLVRFLADNPSEFVLVSIQETAKPSQNSRSFEETARSYFSEKKTLWHLTLNSRTLPKCEGKHFFCAAFPPATLWESMPPIGGTKGYPFRQTAPYPRPLQNL